MRLLPCRTRTCAARGYATLGAGPYLMGRAPTRFPFRYQCGSCRFPTTLDAVEFNGLRELSLAELDELGALGPLLKDLRGAGFADFRGKDGETVRPAEHLFAAGFGPVELQGIDRSHEDDRQWESAESSGLFEERTSRDGHRKPRARRVRKGLTKGT